MTDQEDQLLNLALGLPVRQAVHPVPTQACNRSEHSSYSGSPMSPGSPARVASLALALRVRTHLTTPAIYNSRRQQPPTDEDEEMDAARDDAEEQED